MADRAEHDSDPIRDAARYRVDKLARELGDEVSGPPVVTPTRDVEAEVAVWRARRPR